MNRWNHQGIRAVNKIRWQDIVSRDRREFDSRDVHPEVLPIDNRVRVQQSFSPVVWDGQEYLDTVR